MDNEHFKKNVQMRKEADAEFKAFVAKDKKFQAELKDVVHDVADELEDIGEEMQEFAALLSDPKYKIELEAIGKKIEATNQKIKRNMKFDDEGL